MCQIPEICGAMCTVTYLPGRNGPGVLTQSRDEHISRMPSTPPRTIALGDLQILRPVDGDAGGTWMAVSDRQRAVSLMNGAFVPHHRTPPYRRSRGLVLMDSFGFASIADFANNYDFEAIEPFTMLVVDAHSDEAFSELRWDGHRVHLKMLDAALPQIWSSAPLYKPEAMQQREKWFRQWLGNHGASADSLLRFHEEGGAGEASNSIRMARPNGMQTVSLTQVTWKQANVCMSYRDFRNGAQEAACLELPTTS